MSDLGFLARYAVRSLLRGGQRSLLAVVCIAFGVLSLVGLQLLAHVVGLSTNVEPRLAVGGDVGIARESGFTTGDLAAFDSLSRSGTIAEHTLSARGETAMLRSTRSGRVQFVARALAVEPATYPLTGSIDLGGPGVAAALSPVGSVIISRDLALNLGVGAGDTLRYGGATQTPATLVVGAVAGAMPDRRGQTMLYSFQTAKLLDPAVVPTRATMVAQDEQIAADALQRLGFTVDRASLRTPDRAGRVFSTMLRGAGLLGLIIGGIGIAYTLQVMLTRRRLEIATLRTIGFRTSRLLVLFGTEAMLLGVLGGVAGALLALALSAQLVHLLDRTAGALMLEYVVAWRYVFAGPLLGIATAVLFGLAAIVRASAVRPAVLLRDMPVRAPAGAAAGAGALHVLIAVVFALLAASVMGSLVAGAAVVAIAAIGCVVLGALLVAMLWLTVRIPLPRLPLINMARANLRSRQVRSAFSLIALFVGTFAIGFAATAMMSGSEQVAKRRGSDEGLNVRIFVGENDRTAAYDVLRASGAGTVVESRTIDVTTRTGTGQHLSLLGQAEALDPDAAAVLIDVQSGELSDEGALVPEYLTRPPFSLQAGDTLHVSAGGVTVALRIGGSYRGRDNDFFATPRGLVIAPSTADRLGAANVSLLAELDPDRLPVVVPRIGSALPSSMVLSRGDVNDFIVSQYRSLFVFVAAVAGLALLAGAVLIANSVALAMVERRRELGVLKAVGYTSGRVLRTILLENAGLGVVAGVAGVVAVRIVAAILNTRQPGIDLALGPVPALLLVLTASGLAMAAAALVAWRPVHVRPLEVLRDE